jgi:uncharacterized protein (UPF0303 family)
MLHAGLPGSTPDNDGWLDRKCRVVERFHRSSLRLKVSHTDPAVPVEQAYRLDRTVYAADGGAFPITVRGTGVVGAIAVSGLSDVEDHAFVARWRDAGHLAPGAHREPGHGGQPEGHWLRLPG